MAVKNSQFLNVRVAPVAGKNVASLAGKVRTGTMQAEAMRLSLPRHPWPGYRQAQTNGQRERIDTLGTAPAVLRAGRPADLAGVSGSCLAIFARQTIQSRWSRGETSFALQHCSPAQSRSKR